MNNYWGHFGSVLFPSIFPFHHFPSFLSVRGTAQSVSHTWTSGKRIWEHENKTVNETKILPASLTLSVYIVAKELSLPNSSWHKSMKFQWSKWVRGICILLYKSSSQQTYNKHSAKARLRGSYAENLYAGHASPHHIEVQWAPFKRMAVQMIYSYSVCLQTLGGSLAPTFVPRIHNWLQY